MHVNLYPPTVVMEFNFVHAPPAFTAADAVNGAEINKLEAVKRATNFLIVKAFTKACQNSIEID